jgi:glycosyltransferase involved in cell wall biosynthesis
MKRILIGVTYYCPYISGVSVYAKILAEELAKKNRVEVIGAKFQKELKKEEIINNVIINRVQGWQIGKGFLMWQYPIISFKKVKNNDIVNCHLPSIESFWLALWAKILKKKLIVTFHCRFDSENKFLNLIIELIHLPALIWAEKIVVNSLDYVKGNNLLNNYQDKIVEIFPPIKIKKSGGRIKINGKYKIGYLGRISKEKNIECLIKAFLKLPKNYVLVLAGPEKIVGEKKYQKNILNLIKKNENIFKIGEIDNPVKFFNSINCLVLPSNNPLESFGMVAAEAIKSGCPVITSDIPGVRLPVKLSKMGELFESNKSEELKNKIILVCKNGKEFYKKRAKNLELFDYKKTVKKYEKIF